MKKRICSLLLCLVILTSLLTGCKTENNNYTMSTQFTEAVNAGIAWESLANKAQAPLQTADAVQLMENSMQALGKETSPSYLQFFSTENSSDASITRGQLAQLLWCVYVNVTYGDESYYDDTHLISDRINGAWINYEVGKYYQQTDMAADESEVYDILGENGWIYVTYVISAYDFTNGEKLMPLYSDNTFRPNELVSTEEAVGIFLRYVHSFEPDARYVDVAYVGTHTIDSSLYCGETALPDASNQDLPQWKGFNISLESMLIPGCLSHKPDENSYRAEIAYIKDLGGNYAHIYLSWSWFQGPDYTGNSKVNLSRLERLDKIISWCMEEDIHLQLVFNDIPNIIVEPGLTMDDWFEASHMVFTDETVRNTVTEFWRMLAKRYADIPNNYLSFNLMNECNPLDDENYAWAFQDAVNAIWEESPNRVIVADVHGDNITGESMAELGCALSYHLYSPQQIAMVNSETENNSPGYYENLEWPIIQTAGIIYGPDAKDDFPKLADKEVTLSGNLDNAQLKMDLYDISGGNEIIQIKADNTILYNGTPEYTYIEENDQRKPTEPICVTIPEGTQVVTLACTEGYAFSMTKCHLIYPDGTTVNLNPIHDGWHGMEYVDVQIDNDYQLTGSVWGTPMEGFDFSNAKNGLVSLNDVITIGEKHGVDVMIGECGIFESSAGLPFGMSHETTTAFIQDEIELFESLGLAWTCELYGRYTILTPAPYLKNTEYEKKEGMPYYANKSMESFFKEMLQ